MWHTQSNWVKAETRFLKQTEKRSGDNFRKL